MLAITVRVVAAVAVAGALAAPVAAHRFSHLQLDTRLMEMRGEVVSVSRTPGREEPTRISLLIKNTNYSGKRQPGHHAVWPITVDSELLKAAGLTKPMLLGRKDVTFVGYRDDNKECGGLRAGKCNFAGRQIRFDDGCTVFVGRPAPVFGRKAWTWGWNLPDDGLDKVDSSRC